jgi:dTMP kinase
MFITYEGRDGGGKSTGALELKERLEAKGKKVYLKHFPDYDSTIGGLIGEILAGKHPMPSFEALQMLYVADQMAFQKELEELLFDEKAIVICDRYDFSTLAYYISKTGCSIQDGINLIYKKWQVELRKPDVTFVYNFKGDLDERRKDDNKEKDEIEKDDVITNSINDVYLDIAQSMSYINDGRDIYIVNSENDIEHNAKFCLSTVEAEEVFITKYMTNDREFKNKQIEPF